MIVGDEMVRRKPTWRILAVAITAKRQLDQQDRIISNPTWLTKDDAMAPSGQIKPDLFITEGNPIQRCVCTSRRELASIL